MYSTAARFAAAVSTAAAAFAAVSSRGLRAAIASVPANRSVVTGPTGAAIGTDTASAVAA
jgi:hypothetical protein